MTREEQEARAVAVEIEGSSPGVMASANEHDELDEWYVTVDMDVAVAKRFAAWLRAGKPVQP